MSKTGSRPGIWQVLGQALSLNADLYENARDTPRNRRIALFIVLLAAVSHMLGSLVILVINRATPLGLLLALLLDGLSVVAGYYFWSFTTWKIGQWMKPSDPTLGDLLCPTGFAYAPQVLNFLTLIPLLGRPIELVLAVWSLLAVVVAVRQALDINTRRAAIICLVGWTSLQTAIGFIQVIEQQLVK